MVSDKCIFIQPLKKASVNGRRTFLLDVDKTVEQRQILSGNLSDWMVVELINVPPSLHTCKLGMKHPSTNGCFFMVKPGTEALLMPVFAATRAYHNMNVKQMKHVRSITGLAKPKKAPIGDAAWARYLMTQKLPDWSNERIDKAIALWRGSTKRQPVVEVYVLLVRVASGLPLLEALALNTSLQSVFLYAYEAYMECVDPFFALHSAAN